MDCSSSETSINPVQKSFLIEPIKAIQCWQSQLKSCYFARKNLRESSDFQSKTVTILIFELPLSALDRL
jgi:hypothetical protein